TGIVRIPEIDQNPGVVLQRDVTQHLGELASGEFARSTSAAHHLGEPLLPFQKGHLFSQLLDVRR
ncbi:MAG TPA: hypothetical protein VGQ10_09795, partial [Vicinamibacterales bacterium]|nr:hypothetical protein [Vicinamibacterales bacterium]